MGFHPNLGFGQDGIAEGVVQTLCNAGLCTVRYFAAAADEIVQFPVSCGFALMGESAFGAARVEALEIIACGSDSLTDGTGFPGGKGLNSTKLVRLNPRANLVYGADTTHVGIMFVEEQAAVVTDALRRVLVAVGRA